MSTVEQMMNEEKKEDQINTNGESKRGSEIKGKRWELFGRDRHNMVAATLFVNFRPLISTCLAFMSKSTQLKNVPIEIASNPRFPKKMIQLLNFEATLRF